MKLKLPVYRMFCIFKCKIAVFFIETRSIILYGGKLCRSRLLLWGATRSLLHLGAFSPACSEYIFTKKLQVAVTHYTALVIYRGNNGGKLSNCKLTVCSPEVAQETIQIHWHIIKLLPSLHFIQVCYYVSYIFLVRQDFCTSSFKRAKDRDRKQCAAPEENQSSRLWRWKWSYKSLHHLFFPTFFLFLRFSLQCLLLGQKHSYQQHLMFFFCIVSQLF